MELKLGNGIGQLVFGMTISEVTAILGSPDKVLKDEDDDNQLLYFYNGYFLTLTFYNEEDDKLGYIRCANPDLTFEDKKIIHNHIANIMTDVFVRLIIPAHSYQNLYPSQNISCMSEEAVGDWDIEEYSFCDIYFNEHFWLSLHVEYERVVRLELGCPFKNDEEYDWPSLTSLIKN